MLFKSPRQECLGEIRNVGLGGLHARLPKADFEEGDRLLVGPPGGEQMEYDVCWVSPSGAGLEIGLQYPHSVAGFWTTWAADLLAGGRITHAEVFERRSQVRLECALKAQLKFRRRQYPAMVLDLGAGGVLLESAAPLENEQSVYLSIKTPIQVGHLPCRVARVWTDRSMRYGLCFEELKERHRLALVRLLDLLFKPR